MRFHLPKPADPETEAEVKGLGKASLVALISGLLIGVIGAFFRGGLDWLATKHLEMVEWAHQWNWMGWVIPVAAGALSAGIARLLVRPQPLASGSGVQHVEAVMRDEASVASFWVVPIKFFGGLLGIGMGLALGREGPTVQMGATISGAVARVFRCGKEMVRDLQGALGGAGLAVAFNAPVGGAMFVFEEVSRAFRLRLIVVTMIATGSAIAVCRTILGDSADFHVEPLAESNDWTLALYFIFGLLSGLAGVFYNWVTIMGLRIMDNWKSWPPELKAALVGGIVGLVAWFGPNLVGGGDYNSQRILSGGVTLGMVLIILVIRWVLGPLSYSIGTPGGLFAPLLLVGAAMGAGFAGIFNLIAPDAYAVSTIAFAVVGMTAFFTSVVRAPFTGIILISEMTTTVTLMVPMMIACFASMLAASLVRGAPIYDTLRARMLHRS